MPFRTIHDVQRGVHRLIHSPRDVVAQRPDAPRTPLPIAQATPEHRALFDEYKEHLDEALDIAEQWWDGLIQTRIDAGADLRGAVQAAYDLAFAGPAARPEVVWTIRTFWLHCHALNAKVPAAQRVDPQVMLLGWLIDDGKDEWVQVLTGMPYWPIGVDEHGEWV
jgi:hypothetical protein